MKRMVTEEEIIKLIEEHAIPIEIDENPTEGSENAVSSGGVFAALKNKVSLIDGPIQAPIDESMRAKMREGIFLNGTLKVSGLPKPAVNPVIFPGGYNSAEHYSTHLMLYAENEYGVVLIARYLFIRDTGALNVSDTIFLFDRHNAQFFDLELFSIMGKRFPSYPTDQTNKRYHILLNNRNLAWSSSNGLYLHTVVFDVGGGQSFTIRIISDSASACALDTGTGNFTITGSTFIQPANMGNVVINPFAANQFTPDIYAFDSATGAFTDNITLASVTSDTVTPIG